MKPIKKYCKICKEGTEQEQRIYLCCVRYICTQCGEHTSEKRTD